MVQFGYVGANSVDGSDYVAVEVAGVNDGNVYLTKEAAQNLLLSLFSAGVKVPAEFADYVEVEGE